MEHFVILVDFEKKTFYQQAFLSMFSLTPNLSYPKSIHQRKLKIQHFEGFIGLNLNE